MDYRNGYHKDHPVIKMFWTVFNDLPVEAKRKFLGIIISCKCTLCHMKVKLTHTISNIFLFKIEWK